MTKILTLILSSSFIISCSKKKESNPDLVTYDIKIQNQTTLTSSDNVGEMAASSLPEELQKLKDQINSGQPVSFKKITELYLADHVHGFQSVSSGKPDSDQQSSFENIKTSLESFILNLSTNAPKQYLSQKANYEQKIESQSGKSILYNDKAVTLVDVLNETKLQCFSGTALNLAVSRNIYSGQEYRSQNLVVIFTHGHVQPGQMIKILDKWNLVTVETTESGDAIYDRGPAKYLQSMVIVDAELFVLSEIFKSSLTKEQNKNFSEQILAQTAQKYGLSLPQTKSSHTLQTAQGSAGKQESHESSSTESFAPFNTSPFAFGQPRAQPGDQKRAESRGSASDFYEMLNQLQNMTPEQKGITSELQQIHTQLEKIKKMSCHEFIEKFYYRNVQFNPQLRIFQDSDDGLCLDVIQGTHSSLVSRTCFGHKSDVRNCSFQYIGEADFQGHPVFKFITISGIEMKVSLGDIIYPYGF